MKPSPTIYRTRPATAPNVYAWRLARAEARARKLRWLLLPDRNELDTRAKAPRLARTSRAALEAEYTRLARHAVPTLRRAVAEGRAAPAPAVALLPVALELGTRIGTAPSGSPERHALSAARFTLQIQIDQALGINGLLPTEAERAS